MSPKRRIHPRCRVDLDVTVESEHNFYSGFAQNLSAGGIFIATHTLHKAGEMLEFSINLPGSSEPIKGVGEVRWVRAFSENSNVPPGVGLRFIRLEPGSLEAIEAFLSTRDPLFFDDDV